MREEEKKPLVIIAGPTAVGKSEAAVALAKKVNGAVISADSMQVYRGMDIGTAKITKAEMQGIPHYLIDVLEPEEEFHVVRFQGLAKKALEEIYEMNRLPILAGGTGFYIQALLYDIDFTEEDPDKAYREELLRIAEKEGTDALYQMLLERDPEAAEAIHPNNQKRIIRALEFQHLSGMPISLHNQTERQKEAAYRAAFFCLTRNRKELYERINARVDEMLKKGLLEEVRALKSRGLRREMVSMQGLGYQEILRYLEGEITLEEAITLIKTGSRHFAKRQLTWMKRERDVIWLDRKEYPETEALVSKMLRTLEEKGIYDAAG